jgi:DNA-directed RNA polymerase specialized sigma24 family protein
MDGVGTTLASERAEATFEELYPGLFRHCHQLTGDPDPAEDVVHEAFVRLYDRQVEGTDQGLRAQHEARRAEGRINDPTMGDR